jgi:hypothetical protein
MLRVYSVQPSKILVQRVVILGYFEYFGPCIQYGESTVLAKINEIHRGYGIMCSGRWVLNFRRTCLHDHQDFS